MNISGTLLGRHSKRAIQIVLFLTTIALIVILYPKEYRFKYDFQLNKPWMHEDLIAPFDFSIQKSAEELEQERSLVVEEARIYFYLDKNVLHRQKEKLSADISMLWQKKYGESGTADAGRDEVEQWCGAVLDSIYNTGVIQLNESIEEKEDGFPVFVRYDNIAEERVLGEMFTVSTASDFISEAVRNFLHRDRDIAADAMQNQISQNIFFDYHTTHRERLAMFQNISPSKGIIQKDIRIVAKGELIDSEKHDILRSLKLEYEAGGTAASFYLILLGQVLVISISMVMLILFLVMFRRDILSDNKKITLILSLILIMVLATSLMVRRFDIAYINLLPLCAVPLVVRVFFDTRLGLFVHIITIIITGFLVPNAFEYVFLQLVAGIVTIISNVNVEKRSQFFLTSVYIFITYSLLYTGLSLIQDGSAEGLEGQRFAMYAGSSALTLLSYPLIYFYERIFGYVTNISLLEYSNTNTGMLRELSLKAPGTFQHSLQVANLAEEAALRVGGNPLLIRTGALYHDIGKMDNPMYFTENQLGGYNPHKELDITASAKIIIGHVERGIERARKYGLPEQIIDFIKTHHGTKKAEYFYKLYKNSPGAVGDDTIFDYSGPVPFSKETAILMMADAVEAASKSLKMPDKESIYELVDSIIDGQIAQKQFRNSDITLKDIARVKTVFKNRLINIYHIRIEYPR
jgi:cyclic-di-AMP phosphodiesterase PgpH